MDTSKFMEVLTALNAQISDGFKFGWTCFGDNARLLTFGSDVTAARIAAAEIQMVFDTKTFKVYELTAFAGNHAWRWIDSSKEEAYLEEHTKRGLDPNKYLDVGNIYRIASWAEALDKAVEIHSKFN